MEVLVGSSKTGSIVLLNLKLHLIFRENFKILFLGIRRNQKILSQLTEYLRPQLVLIKYYQSYLSISTPFLPVLKAQAINGLLPIFSDQQELSKMLPPLPTVPISWKQKNLSSRHSFACQEQIVVIRVPMQEEKEYYPKTVGLLQLMLQSGIMPYLYTKKAGMLV